MDAAQPETPGRVEPHVRTARRSDVPAIADLRVQAMGERARLQDGVRMAPDVRQRSEQMLPVWMGKDGQFLLVATASEEPEADLLGYAMGRIRTDPPVLRQQRVGVIEECFVLPTSRGSGLGRELVATLSRLFETREAHALRASLPPGNEQALERLAGLGYTPLLVSMRRAIGRRS